MGKLPDTCLPSVIPAEAEGPFYAGPGGDNRREMLGDVLAKTEKEKGCLTHDLVVKAFKACNKR